MDKDRQQVDVLEDLFRRMPEENLPASLRQNIMQQVMMEAVKKRKRNETFGLLAVITASLGMLAVAVMAMLYIGIPKVSMPHIQWSSFQFYLYIGALTLLLLLADYKMRKAFRKDE